MNRFFGHPSLPLVTGIVVFLLALAAFLVAHFYPGTFSVSTAQELPGNVVDVVRDGVAAALPGDAPQEPVVSASYVLDVRDPYIKERKSFVEADLTSMTLKVYQDGVVAVDVPIKSKGKEGSWWETPVGVYAIQNKERNHFSSFGHVYQPWSLVFQGNFFIHGWPYYPDGSPVSSQYSGGCIRLADEYAQQVYAAVQVGTPVLVYKRPVEAPALPAFTGAPDVAGSYALIDVPSGTTIRSHDAGQEVAMGSVVHLLTALTTVDYLNVESNLNVSESTSPRLAGYSTVSVLDLLRLLLAEGDGAAAHALARSRGTDIFVRRMNAKAAAIGMLHTRIASVSPTDSGNITTAGDVALLARYLAQNRSFVLQLTRSAGGNAAYDPPIWSNLGFNQKLLALPGFVGGVLNTDGGAPSVVVSTMTIAGTARPVVFVVTERDPLAALGVARSWLSL